MPDREEADVENSQRGFAAVRLKARVG